MTEPTINKGVNEPEQDEVSKLKPAEQSIITKYMREKGSVLVVGCGNGRECFVLAEKGFQVTGIDIREDLIDEANKIKASKKSENTTFVNENILKTSFQNSKFDYVLMLSQVLELIKGREHRVNSLIEVRRVLKDRGTVIFSTHTRTPTLLLKLKWEFLESYYGFLKILKPEKYADFELGDVYTLKVIAAKEYPDTFMHIYSLREVLQDIQTSGLSLADFKSAAELETGVKEKNIANAKYVYFVCAKGAII